MEKIKINKSLSLCCNAETDLETDGDADWKICSECGEPCSTLEDKEAMMKL